MIIRETDRYRIEKKNGKLVGIEKEHEVLKENNVVLIQDISNGLDRSVSEGLDKIGIKSIIKKGYYVAIKINLGGGIHYIPSTYSDPLICESIIKKIKKIGAFPFICEANMRAHKMDNKMLRIRGYLDIMDKTNTKFINLSYVNPVEMKCRNLDIPLLLPSILFNEKVKILSFAPPKPHWECLISCTQKNMYGAISERRKSIYHRKFDRIDHAVAAAARLMSPDICISGCFDLCVGTGPHFGVPIRFNKLIISQDMIRGDKVCSEILGVPYKLVKYAMINTKNQDVEYKLHPDSVKINEDTLNTIKKKTMQVKKVNFWKKLLYFQYFVPHDLQYYLYPNFEFIFTGINQKFFYNE
ncbi:MAG: DUF362 domain-containing protein [Candidatus Helarchaeota archaeon]